MARRKVRKYETVEDVRRNLNNYFYLHNNEVIQDLLEKTGFNTVTELQYAECHTMRFGFDCGWVWAGTKNSAQRHEWELDNGEYSAKVNRINYPYNSQSTTCKRIQLNKALEDLGLTDQYYAYVRLD